MEQWKFFSNREISLILVNNKVTFSNSSIETLLSMGSNELCSFIEYTLKVKIFNKGDYDLNSGIEKKYFQDLVSSAVLIPIYKKENSYFTILTKRSSNLNSHPGQISFPGGRYEKKDISIEQTAIREADEEIGVKKSNIRLLGRLDHYQTRTGFDIVPIVCFLNSLPKLNNSSPVS